MPVITPGGALSQIISPLLRLAGRLVGRESPWARVGMRVPAGAFGPGSERPFTAYFDGDSCVGVASIGDIVAWLQTCEYVSDVELFQKRDFWQHPRDFEISRRGDCEDFALWAWRKLGELGIDADFCVGRVVSRDRPDADHQHAWVVYRIDGTAFLFEPAARTPSHMIRPLAGAMEDYVPHFAVNHRFETDAFVGCAVDARRASARPDDSRRHFVGD
jgi:hypothetical protein